MRIIAGTVRGATIAAPKGLATRPVTERVRGAVFNIVRDEVPGAVVLDLFAGTGSLGLEALSRGATRCVFVERRRSAVVVLRRNIEKLGFEDRARVLAGDAFSPSATRPDDRFDLVFVDPPYRLTGRLDQSSEMAGLMSNLFGGDVLKEGAVVVLRAPRRSGALWLPQAAVTVDVRQYGADTVRFIGRRRPGPDVIEADV